MGRTPCCDKTGLKKGPWTPEEDQKLVDYIQKHGYGNWRTLPKNAGLQRCGKSCRLRWTNYLRPDIKRGRFTFEEEETIIQLHSLLGNKWSVIAGRLPGRTDNEIKNYWNTHIRKRLLRMGIDPVTHSPRLDLLDLSNILSSSLINSSQMHISRLLGLQNQLINPEWIRLATSLINQHQNQNQNPIQTQNSNQNFNMGENELSNTRIQNELDTFIQHEQYLQNPIQENISCPPLINQEQTMNPTLDSYPSSNAIPSNFIEDYGVLHGFNACDQTVPDFKFPSVLSTPSPSPTPLNSNSNSTYMNSISSCSTTEDERESDYSNIMKFEIPEFFNNGFM